MKACLRLLVVVAFYFTLHGVVSAQGFQKILSTKSDTNNFREIARQVDMYYDTAMGMNRSGYKQWKRWEWFASHHLDENGNLENYVEKNMQAVEELNKNMPSATRSTSGDWFQLGHSIAGPEAKQGRVNSIAFDPVNGSIIYAATAAGGIWKSFNNGDFWINLTTDLPILGIADIVVSPAPNNHIVYALTGDIVGSANVYVHSSIGVIKSYDSGNTWERTGLTVPLSNQWTGFKLLMHPNNPNFLLAAMSDGIRRTTDGGATWFNIAPIANVNDMEFKPSDPNQLYFTTLGSSTFRTINLMTNVISSTFVNTDIAVDRMEIAVTPDNGNAVYLLAGPGYLFFGANLFNGLFYSGNSGSTFTERSVSCNNNGDLFNSSGSLSWYANSIYVDPFEENYVIVGGLNLFNSVNGGVNLSQITFNSIHADQHNIKRNPVNGQMWLCNDGGIYRSFDSGNTWENKSSGLVITEYYRISGTNNVTDRLIGGTQDNGHFRRVGSNFEFVMGGDGMDNYFNSSDNSIVYASSQNGGLARSTNFGASFSATSLPAAGNDNMYTWITPFVQHPPFAGNTDVIYVYSKAGILRSTDGVDWDTIGLAGAGQAAGSLCPSMVIGNSGGVTNLYVSNGNNFWVSSNSLQAIPTWQNFPLPIGANAISAMAVNPVNRNEVWVAISGYTAGTKVFRTFNAGATWINLSLSLPNTPVYSIVFANANNSPSGAVYVGTEIGIFYTDDAIPDWIPYSNGLPHVPITDLSVNYVTSELKAATYGRGIWRSDLYQPCPSLVLVDYDIDEGQYNFESSNQIYANHWITGGLGAQVRMRAGSQIRVQNGFKASAGTSVKMSIGNCGTGVWGFSSNSTEESTSVSKPNLQKGKAVN